MSASSFKLQSLKLFLACTAQGADPIGGEIFPLGAGSNAVVGITGGLIIDIAAGLALILLYLRFLLSASYWLLRVRVYQI